MQREAEPIGKGVGSSSRAAGDLLEVDPAQDHGEEAVRQWGGPGGTP